MTLELRDYQKKIIEEIRAAFIQGKKRVVVQLVTGAGKSVIASHIIESAIAKGKKCAFVVDMKALVNQTVSHLKRHDLKVGVMQAEHDLTYMLHLSNVDVISIQTLQRRKIPKYDLIFIDEVHTFYKRHIELLEHNKNAFVIGLSATPWRKGLADHFDHLILGPTTKWMIDNGFLSKAVEYVASKADMSSYKRIKTFDGEEGYSDKDSLEAMQKVNLSVNIVDNWIARGQNRQTLCFPVNVAHSQALSQEFRQKGIMAVHVDASTPDPDRERVFAGFRAGRVKVICSVNVITKGFDIPIASCLIIARPVRSAMQHYQMLGRGLRIAPGKEDCLIFDHAGNLLELGRVTDGVQTWLSTGEKEEKEAKKKATEERVKGRSDCPDCGFLLDKTDDLCPNCGRPIHRRTDVIVSDGKMEKVDKKAKEVKPRESYATLERWYHQLFTIAVKRGWSTKSAAIRFKEKFGFWPYSSFQPVFVDTIDPDVARFTQHQDIKGFHARKKKNAGN